MNTTLSAKHSSKSNEHFTPSYIVEKARGVLGTIDLDPASCPKANEAVKAKQIYTIEDNGLIKEWFGNVFLNPPGGKTNNKSNQALFWRKLIREYETNGVDNAIFVGFSIEMFQTVQTLLGQGDKTHPLDYSICIPSRRIAFIDPEGNEQKSPPHSNFISFLSRSKPKNQTFFHVFSELGVTYVR